MKTGGSVEQDKPYASSLSEENFLWVLASFRQPHHIPFDPVLVIESSTTPYGLGLLPKALDAMEQRVLLLGNRLMLFQMKNNPKLSHSVGECAGGNDGERWLAL
jgi:hypothetical protein